MEHGTERKQAGDARIMQPAVRRQDRKSRIGESDQQIERREPAPLPWGERASSPFLARIKPQRRGRPLRVPPNRGSPFRVVSERLRRSPRTTTAMPSVIATTQAMRSLLIDATYRGQAKKPDQPTLRKQRISTFDQDLKRQV
jgi:hypothetical protein